MTNNVLRLYYKRQPEKLLKYEIDRIFLVVIHHMYKMFYTGRISFVTEKQK